MTLRRFLPVILLALPLLADEGMWLFSQFPKDAFKQKYETGVTDAFLDHLRLSTVRIGAGAGAFVSAHGLIVTNQRLVTDCLAKANDLENGFYAGTAAQEIRCAALDAQVLSKIENVTEKVKAAANGISKAADALEKRNAAISALEKDCAARTGNVCSVVKLYSGERYDLYQYKKYGDVRLVFAPEREIAQFGGNPANNTFPRYALDTAFLRAYDNGAPAATPEFLKWGEGVKDGAVVFAAGSPSATNRLSTVAQLNFYHDIMLPIAVGRLQSRILDLRAFAAKSPENKRAAESLLVRLGSEYKLLAGKLIGLNDATLMARKANFEKRLRNAAQRDPKIGAEGGKVWDDVAAAYKTWAPFEREYQILANPMNDAADPGVKAVLEARYQEEVKTLKEKHQADGARARILKKRQEIIEALETSAAEKIASYRYRIFGDADYPDATGTLRLSFGVVKAYKDRAEAPVPYTGTFGGLYYFAAPQDPYQLPQRWAAGKSALDLATPMNFASTCDITGGPSGPVVNTAGELVGVTFDGNIESIALTYLYSDETARAVHVASQGIVEALRKLYHTPELLQELGIPPAVHGAGLASEGRIDARRAD